MNLVTAEGKMCFKFDPGAGWFQFDGKINLQVVAKPAQHAGVLFVTDSDLQQTVLQLLGKNYQSDGFNDIPGIVTTVTLEIDNQSLCHRMQIHGAPTVTTETHGTFRVVCTPSFKAAPVPIPDPQPVKSGTWSIEWNATPRTIITA